MRHFQNFLWHLVNDPMSLWINSTKVKPGHARIPQRTRGLDYLVKSRSKFMLINNFFSNMAFNYLAAVLPANQIPGLKSLLTNTYFNIESNWTLETYFNEIWIKMKIISVKEIYLKLFAKLLWPQCVTLWIYHTSRVISLVLLRWHPTRGYVIQI